MAAPTHPFAVWRDQTPTPRDRYAQFAATYQEAVRRAVIGGMHIHAGFGDADTRIRVMTAIRRYLLLLHALSTSSPFNAGHETGFKSYRLTIMGNLPRTGMPGPLQSRAEYERLVGEYRRMPKRFSAFPTKSSELWWDIRPSQAYPTVEMRIVRDPLEESGPLPYRPHAGIGLPAELYGDARRNSAGVDLSDIRVVEPLLRQMGAAAAQQWEALPIVDGESIETVRVPVHDPADSRRTIGTVHEADVALARRAIDVAVSQTESWAATPVDERAAVLEEFADLLEARQAEVMARCVREAGKTVADAVSEVREAVDYGRYYAMCARRDFAEPAGLLGPTGEKNSIALSGRGAFVCISPWNFPLAIFAGQVAAALASGNTVIAKPAEQTALTACFATRLLHEAGVPPGVLQFVPGRGETFGGALAGDPRIAGVAFTGSTETARLIARTLAERAGPIVPLIAETGGQNAMIVDSSALTEQVVADVLQSAFYGAGQRCSCLRVLFLQAEIAPRVLTMLSGAMAELRLGDPMQLSTDIGPVIDEAALEALRGHAARISRTGTVHAQTPGGEATVHGTFFRPLVVEIDGIGVLEREVFGPILHVVRYATDRLDAVIDAVNATGYGLTLGVHSRLGSATSTSIATWWARSSVCSRSAAKGSPGPDPKQAGRDTCTGSPPSARSRSTPWPPAAIRPCSPSQTMTRATVSVTPRRHHDRARR